MDTQILSQAATIARGLAIDAVHKAGIGHLGLPLGAAEMGAVLYGYALQHNPDEPRWINRDRFVLSAGHGSMFLYGWLHLSGYDLPMQQLKDFRQLHSSTPGHPEFNEAPGVEATTGPLGQGVGNAVGMAAAAKMTQARFNTDDATILDYHVICLAGDGCMQEGVAQEAAAYAGRFGLDNLILIYDSNDVTLDAQGEETQSEDTALRFYSYGFDVVTIDGHDMNAFLGALEAARRNDNGRPKLIEAKTLIGKGIPQVEGTWKAHGEGGHKFADEAREGLGLPKETFYVADEVKNYFEAHKKQLATRYEAWQDRYNAWKKAHPDLARELEERDVPDAKALFDAIPAFPDDAKLATRAAAGEVIQPMAKALPRLISGSADLHGSTKNEIKDVGFFDRDEPKGRNLRFGIREHAMGAMLNGFAYDNYFLASGATFLSFSDYMRASIRLAALSKLHLFYIFTHDSIGVGEDGPTHQPVEQTSSLRLIPHLHVIRPADPEETAGAMVAAATRGDGPTALILSRQSLPNLTSIPVEERRQGVLRGGYIARKESGDLRTIIIGTGSELQHAMAAAEKLGEGVRVVSMPCAERFDAQDEAYRESVLPAACKRRVAIEAGALDYWWKYVGLDGKVIGIDRFGLSAPGDEVMKELGMTADNVVAAVKELG